MSSNKGIMKDNTGRVMTLRITITDSKEAEWIWNAHKGEGAHGVKVDAISNGDVMAERDELANAAQFYIREAGESTEDAIDAHCKSYFHTADEAASKANNNVARGAKWDVVDAEGNVYRSGVSSEG